MDQLGRSRFAESAALVLMILAERPMPGTLIAADIERVTGRRLGPGTLCGAIAQLELAGLIEGCNERDGAKAYQLTAAGRFAAQMQVWCLNAAATNSGHLRCRLARLRRATP